MLLVDNWKSCYLANLKVCEASGMPRPGTVQIADYVDISGAPNGLEYVGTSRKEGNVKHESKTCQTTIQERVMVSATYLFCF